MVTENFLINPPKKLLKKSPKKSLSSVKNPIPSRLLSKMVKKWGRKGMKKAWEVIGKSKKKKSLKSRNRSVSIKSIKSVRKRKNPFGEEVVVVGALNPCLKRNYWPDNSRGHRRAALKGWRTRKAKISRTSKKRGKRKVKRNAWYGQSRRHSLAARKGWRRNPVINAWYGHSRGHSLATKKGWRRRKRHNPAVKILGMDITKNLPVIGVSSVSLLATSLTPAIVKAQTPVMKYGSQIAVGVGGGALINTMQKNKALGLAWMTTALAVMLADVAKSYLLKGMFGLSAYPEYSAYDDSAYDAYPEELEAYPEELEGYANDDEIEFEAYPEEISSYPL